MEEEGCFTNDLREIVPIEGDPERAPRRLSLGDVAMAVGGWESRTLSLRKRKGSLGGNGRGSHAPSPADSTPLSGERRTISRSGGRNTKELVNRSPCYSLL